MGGVESKPDLSPTESQGAILEPKNVPSDAIVTPKSSRENLHKDYLDPRSPSKRFARTPVELLSAVADKLEALTIETASSDKVAEETPLKRHVILRVDPRSPSFEVQRTPIVVSALPDEQLLLEIRNKNLEKVKCNALLSTPTTASKSWAKGVPPKLLSSCPVTPKLKADSSKRKSLVLLETNVDYTETDLDVVIREKYLGAAQVTDPRSPAVDFPRTPLLISSVVTKDNEEHLMENANNQVAGDVEEHIAVCIERELSESDEDGASVNLETTSEEILESADSEELQQDMLENPEFADSKEKPKLELPHSALQDDIKTFDSSGSLILTESQSKSAPVSPPNIVSVTPKKPKSEPISPVRNLLTEVLELDKKLTNLIYEDEDPVVWPRAVKPTDQNRTPLGVRNGNTHQSKPASKLIVSDKPRKSQYNTSRIPVFKDKRIKVQCENTPPKSMRALRQPKKPSWDPKDETLFL